MIHETYLMKSSIYNFCRKSYSLVCSLTAIPSHTHLPPLIPTVSVVHWSTLSVGILCLNTNNARKVTSESTDQVHVFFFWKQPTLSFCDKAQFYTSHLPCISSAQKAGKNLNELDVNILRKTNSVAPYSYDLFSLHRPFDLNGPRRCKLQILNGNDQ